MSCYKLCADGDCWIWTRTSSTTHGVPLRGVWGLGGRKSAEGGQRDPTRHVNVMFDWPEYIPRTSLALFDLSFGLKRPIVRSCVGAYSQVFKCENHGIC